MALRLTVTSLHARSMGARHTKEFGHDGGTIGRSLESDWVLPDGQRFVSSRHASIDFRSGSYYIVDTSTNGVFVNAAEQPVGRGKPQRLFSGDRIRIGDYEIDVEVDDAEDAAQVSDERHIDPVDLAQRVEAPEPSGGDLVDAYEVTGVGIEELLTEDEATTLTAPSKLDEIELEIDDRPAPKARPASRLSASKTKTAGLAAPRASGPAPARDKPAFRPEQSEPMPAHSGKTSHVLDPFFRGAGLVPQRIDPQQADAILLRLGQLMREMVVGVAESLHLRAEQQNSLRLPATTQQRGNNPLEFSAGVEETLTSLLFRQSQEFLSPIEAVREAYGDLRLHQQSLLRALHAALDAFAKRLNPDDLEQKFSHGKSGRLMGAANKLKYWDLYKDLYQIVAHHPHGELPAQFLDDFVQAYEAEIARAPTRDGEKHAQVS